jgi:hypothetical protein
MRLPPVLGPDDLPLPERMAARLDGELFVLGGSHCPVDAVETPALRLAAALAGRSPRYIAELATAAWVWGAQLLAPDPVQLCVSLQARARPARPRDIAVREVVLRPSEIRWIGPHQVTSPLRTAIDLARSREGFDPAIVRELARIGGFDVSECLNAMDARRNLPGKRLAAARLQDALTR